MVTHFPRWTNAGIVTLAMLLVGSIWLQAGRIAESRGLGYDGEIYAAMTTQGLDAGGDNARMRPLVILLNRVMYGVTAPDVIGAFQLMNVVYAALLAWVLCAILDLYGVSSAHKIVFTLNVFATIAVTKMFAFYPVLIDLGAYLFVALAVYSILRGNRLWIVVATLLAVFAREFGLVVILFGVHRDLRLRVRLPMVAATYAPALAAFIALRQWVIATSPEASGVAAIQGGLVSAGDIAANLSRGGWLFPVFFAYFTAAVFGGISILLVLRALRGRLRLGGETEWITYLGCLGLLTLAGPDVWRYLAYGVPAVAALYAGNLAAENWRLVAPWSALLTAFTQRPWVRMNDTSFFEDWLPLYLPQFGIPDPPTPEFWLRWSVRGAVVIGIAMLAWMAQRPAPTAGGVRLATEGDWRILGPWGGLVTVMFMQAVNVVRV